MFGGTGHGSSQGELVEEQPRTLDDLLDDPKMTFGAVRNMPTWEMLKVMYIYRERYKTWDKYKPGYIFNFSDF